MFFSMYVKSPNKEENMNENKKQYILGFTPKILKRCDKKTALKLELLEKLARGTYKNGRAGHGINKITNDAANFIIRSASPKRSYHELEEEELDKIEVISSMSDESASKKRKLAISSAVATPVAINDKKNKSEEKGSSGIYAAMVKSIKENDLEYIQQFSRNNWNMLMKHSGFDVEFMSYVAESGRLLLLRHVEKVLKLDIMNKFLSACDNGDLRVYFERPIHKNQNWHILYYVKMHAHKDHKKRFLCTEKDLVDYMYPLCDIDDFDIIRKEGYSVAAKNKVIFKSYADMCDPDTGIHLHSLTNH